MSGSTDICELGTPGPMRQKLIGLVLAGAKQATASLVADYGPRESIPSPGQRFSVVDDHGDHIAMICTTRVEIHRFIDVPWEFAAAEGEGDADIGEWRDGHAEFRGSQGMPVDDESLVVCEWFELE